MRFNSLRTRLLFSFLLVIMVLGVLSALFGYRLIKSNTIKRAQKQAQSDLSAARSVYDDEIEKFGNGFDCISMVDNPGHLKSKLGLDYLCVVESEHKDSVKSDIVKRAFEGNSNGGTRIIDSCELSHMGEALFRRARIDVRNTPMAGPQTRTAVTGAMAMEYASPIFDADGRIARVMYGGKIVNRYYGLIDKIHDIVYESRLYNAKPVGTVTIFQDDVRIATNVLDKDGGRAIGTRVSARVYDHVIVKGTPFLDRAFVVTDWYLTAYEPIRDINGKIIGILYVGILERPFIDMIHHALLWYLVILGIAALLAGVVAFLLSAGVSKPLTKFVTATANLADGDMTHRVETPTSVYEIRRLAVSFNEMAEKLHQREMSLKDKNSELAVLNGRYLDLVGMVSHELKGILASALLNACSVRDGYLGELTDKQKKALDSVVRNLDYFDMTVKNFLNLSRIEKEELTLTLSNVFLKEDVVDVSVDAFIRQAQAKNITIENEIPFECTFNADSSLLLMVMNNLMGNAIKYGAAGGTIKITLFESAEAAVITVFNTGRPLTGDETAKLFKRFSRLDASPEARKVRGTGLGLFLCKTIIERHGGTIRCEPGENGNSFIVTIQKNNAPATVNAPVAAFSSDKENLYA
jgi:two-component system, NtrC family, sensor kinase